MTKRYFYSDPLAAAYMAREFGVRLCIEADNGGGIISRHDLSEHALISMLEFFKRPRIYIHPDSLPIFEPMVGDLVWVKWLDSSESCAVWDSFLSSSESALDRDIRTKPTIIQRNNKQFFWPEVEG